MEDACITKRHYIKDSVVKEVEVRIGLLYMLFYFVAPQYFGFQISGFDITLQRIGMILSILFLLEDRTRVKKMAETIRTCASTKYILLYLTVLLYTALMLNNVNSFMGPFIDFICMYITIYFIKYNYGIEKFIRLIIKYAYLLCILGLIEYVMQKSLFSYMMTLPDLAPTNGVTRSGSYRITGQCNHPLGYGLLLVTILPVACINLKNNTVDLFANKGLFILLIVNVLLTGSRSTFVVMFLEIVLVLLFTPKKILRRTICCLVLGIMFFCACVICTYKLSFSRYILMQITSVIDELLGTQLAANFGADVNGLNNSAVYRKILLRLFTMDIVKPYLGGGATLDINLWIDGFRIHSIDNFYLAHYLRFSYPGLVTYMLIIISAVFRMISRVVKEHSGICIAALIGTVCYFINLWWLDTLGTDKYVYILIAIFAALPKQEGNSIHVKA